MSVMRCSGKTSRCVESGPKSNNDEVDGGVAVAAVAQWQVNEGENGMTVGVWGS